MALDPRKFFVKQCGNKQAAIVAGDTKRKDFFNSLGKIGDVELLNNSALSGKVGQGLRSLAGISNSIRIGDPTSAIPQNGTDVLIATGISQASAQKAGSFNPGVFNKATAAADQIADQVKNGQFSLSNIPNSFTDIQNLSTLVDGIFTDDPGKDERIEICQASPYAMDLIAYAPKYKFLFIVEFIYTAPYAKAMDHERLAFVIKNSSRPHINFEHEEVNMYNFWTRIPKRTSYEPMTMRFYDDNYNAAMHMYEAYLKAVSPIANLAFAEMMEDKPEALESQSMNFGGIGTQKVHGGDQEVRTHGYSASMGPVSVESDNKNVFKRINIYHVYRYGNYINQYKFLNPKVLSLELDELDMADNGNGNELSFQFAYDAVHITTDIPVASIGQDIIDKQVLGVYPLKPNFGGQTNEAPQPGEGDPDEGGGFFAGAGAAAGSVTGAITGAIDYGTGVVSNAFTSVSEFSGSIFSDFATGASSAEASVKNSINGNVESSK